MCLFCNSRQDNLTLTATIAKEPETIDASYDIPEIYNYLDYVTIKTYDYNSFKNKKTGFNTPLLPLSAASDQQMNVQSSLNYLIKQNGMIPEKIA